MAGDGHDSTLRRRRPFAQHFTKMPSANIDSLPTEVRQKILSNLPLLALFNCMRVSKTWNSEASIVLRKRGTQLHEVDYQRCRDPEHNKSEPSSILQVPWISEMKNLDVEYVLTKMGAGLQVLIVKEYEKKVMIYAGDALTPNLECLQLHTLHTPDKALSKLKHLHVSHTCEEDILHRLNEWFPSLEDLNVGNLPQHFNNSRQARFRLGMKSISLPSVDLYEVSQWPALETLKTLTLINPTCSSMFTFQAPLLEDLWILNRGYFLEEHHEWLAQSIRRCPSLKNLHFLWLYMNVNLTKHFLRGLPQLVDVHLDCLIDDEAVSIIRATAPNIEKLWLLKTSVTDVTLGHLRNLPRLKTVVIGQARSHGITLTGLRKFCREHGMRRHDGNVRFEFMISQQRLLKYKTELEALGVSII